MQVTNDGYILSRNIIRGDVKENKFIKIIKTHKISIILSIVFIILIITEGILLNSFINLLVSL